MTRRLMLLLFLSFTLLFMVSCSSGAEEPTPAPTDPPQPTDVPEPTATPEPPTPEPTATPESNAIRSLEEVETGVIQVVAEGTFIDPEFGLQLNASGSGSGFIIDESGIAVTNNHVVTGAAILQVYVAGEARPVNARVLGVSECSDLAVIDLEGDGYPYLEWYAEDIRVGLDVYAAGFPLGDPEFTLTRGIISKAEADGESDWASVDYVLEHDATINPGNSGGPLVTAEGQVVGVNYAGASATNQYFAVARDEALLIIDQLRSGNNVTSIGVNGVAVDDGGGNTGIWVSSVESGSPADAAGVKSGDIITRIEGLVLATDGTMADYCDILRSHDEDDVLAIEVLRYDTQEILQGQLNGNELEPVFSFAESELAEEVADDPAGATGYSEYTTVNDDSGSLVLEVPVAWGDINGSAWTIDEEEVGFGLSAAPDLSGYYETWTTPGVFFGASFDLAADYTPEQALDDIDFSDSCTYGGREAYSDVFYTGAYDIWEGCGGEDTLFITLAAKPEDSAFLILVQVQIVAEEDLEAFDHILNSFYVITEE